VAREIDAVLAGITALACRKRRAVTSDPELLTLERERLRLVQEAGGIGSFDWDCAPESFTDRASI
jgi:hypothetical protein